MPMEDAPSLIHEDKTDEWKAHQPRFGTHNLSVKENSKSLLSPPLDFTRLLQMSKRETPPTICGLCISRMSYQWKEVLL